MIIGAIDKVKLGKYNYAITYWDEEWIRLFFKTKNDLINFLNENGIEELEIRDD